MLDRKTDGKKGFNPMSAPFLSMVPDQNIIRELAYTKDKEHFYALANMKDTKMAQNFAKTFSRCQRYKRDDTKYHILMMLMCAEKSQRAWMMQQAIAGVSQAVDFEGSKNGKRTKAETTT